MSIINDMLKDLDQRRTNNTLVDHAITDTVIGAPPRNKTNYAKWLLVIIVIAVAFIVYWKTQRPLNNTPATQPATVSVAPAIAQPESVTDTFEDGLPNLVAPPQPDLTDDSIATNVASESTPAALSLHMETRLTDDLGSTQNSTKPQVSVTKTAEATAEKPIKDSSTTGSATQAIKPATNKQIIIKKISLEQQSANHYRQAIAYLQQGRVAETEALLQRSLEDNPRNHDARQMLISLKLDAQRHSDAIQLLEKGIQLSPQQFEFSAALARLQLNSGQLELALNTLETGLSYAGNNPEYHALLAATLQRANQHEKAIQHYLTALQTNPSANTWLVGVGISMQTTAQYEDAQLAFQRALSTGTLSPDMTTFVDQRLNQIKQQLAKSNR